jgi:peptidoglycan/xylan/chitin deacetylase (PgdA/CDA1 family)
VRGFLRQGLPLLVAAALARLARWSGRRAGVALVYHRVAAATGDAARELMPAHGAGLVEAQLRHLAACYRVVPASELPAAVAARRRGQRFPVAITFDDDLRSHRDYALPLLARRGLPATFFLSGASLGAPNAFWWERLQRAVDAELPVGALLPVAGPPAVHDLAATMRRMPPDERDVVAEELRARLGPDPGDAGLREEHVRELVAAGFEIGAHTLRHHYLPQLGDAALGTALVEGRDRLAAIAGREIRTIAYPHGGADRRVAAAARRAGYTAGFATHPEVVLPGDDPLLRGRLEPSLRSATRFAARLLLVLARRRHG